MNKFVLDIWLCKKMSIYYIACHKMPKLSYVFSMFR